jgi:hypothetical protein
MCFELTAKTEPGERVVALAEALAEDIAGRASEHDREATLTGRNGCSGVRPEGLTN